MNSSQKDNVFLNVRKAYRLLHDYQRMVLDILRYISSKLGFEDSGGWSTLGENVAPGFRYVRKSSWTWLPMVCWVHRFYRQTGKECLVVWFLIVSDTGFIEADAEVYDKTVDFAWPEKSSTKFAFILGVGPELHGQFGEDKIQMRNFMKKDGILPEHLVAQGFVGRCYDLSDLDSVSQAEMVIDHLIELAKKQSIPLERIRQQ